ncbi:hypothetical protein [Lacinutrix sp. Hel_I_90]|uniref:hypothetical protein n=1 Tax=Lacinutrix sp. Hel_I_90 TaxID=1249999 RepID=UPI0005C94E1D|nr:hypothetical protein [Lacinutrix sp. Hel_I_90]
MGFIASIIAYLLFALVAIAAFIVVMYKNAKVNGFFKTMNSYWYVNAYELDVFANHHFADFWNVVMRTKGGYRFGEPKETISSAIGKNQRDKTLSWFVMAILYIIDYKYWGKGGHCLNAINN